MLADFFLFPCYFNWIQLNPRNLVSGIQVSEPIFFEKVIILDVLYAYFGM